MEKLKELNKQLLILVNDYNYLLKYHGEEYTDKKMANYENSIKWYLTNIKRINNKIKNKEV